MTGVARRGAGGRLFLLLGVLDALNSSRPRPGLGDLVFTQSVLKETCQVIPLQGHPGLTGLAVLVPTSRARGSLLHRPWAGSLAWRAGGLPACPRSPRLPAAAGLLSTLARCLSAGCRQICHRCRVELSPDSEEVNAPCLNPPLTL